MQMLKVQEVVSIVRSEPIVDDQGRISTRLADAITSGPFVRDQPIVDEDGLPTVVFAEALGDVGLVR